MSATGGTRPSTPIDPSFSCPLHSSHPLTQHTSCSRRAIRVFRLVSPNSGRWDALSPRTGALCSLLSGVSRQPRLQHRDGVQDAGSQVDARDYAVLGQLPQLSLTNTEHVSGLLGTQCQWLRRPRVQTTVRGCDDCWRRGRIGAGGNGTGDSSHKRASLPHEYL